MQGVYFGIFFEISTYEYRSGYCKFRLKTNRGRPFSGCPLRIFYYLFVKISITAWNIFVITLHILVNGPASSFSASSISEMSVASSSSFISSVLSIIPSLGVNTIFFGSKNEKNTSQMP